MKIRALLFSELMRLPAGLLLYILLNNIFLIFNNFGKENEISLSNDRIDSIIWN